MASWARPGVKCVCIRTALPEHRVAGAVYPEVGAIYTIRQVVTVSFGPSKGSTALLLCEIRNDVSINPLLGYEVDSDKEAAMPISAFRPLVTQSDDVAKFTHLLNPTKLPECV